MFLKIDGTAVLGDFGITGRFSRRRQNQNQSKEPSGTVGYIAPELCAGQPFNEKVDMFAAQPVRLLCHNRY